MFCFKMKKKIGNDHEINVDGDVYGNEATFSLGNKNKPESFSTKKRQKKEE